MKSFLKKRGIQFIPYEVYLERIYRMIHYRKIFEEYKKLVSDLMSRLSRDEQFKLMSDLESGKYRILDDYIEELKRG